VRARVRVSMEPVVEWSSESSSSSLDRTCRRMIWWELEFESPWNLSSNDLVRARARWNLSNDLLSHPIWDSMKPIKWSIYLFFLIGVQSKNTIRACQASNSYGQPENLMGEIWWWTNEGLCVQLQNQNNLIRALDVKNYKTTVEQTSSSPIYGLDADSQYWKIKP
jgi:hypothetical protein